MKNSTEEQVVVTTEKRVCCFKFAELMLGLNMGVRVPFLTVLEALKVAEKHGIDSSTGFFVAVTVGHRIGEHGDTLKAAVAFAEWSGVPDLPLRAKPATAADIVDSCEINRELSRAIMSTTSSLPEDVAAEIRAMAKVAKLPEDFTDAQIIVTLHNIKSHGDSLGDAIEFATGDSEFAKAARGARLN